MNSIEWIEKVRKDQDCSYYRVAQLTGMTRQTVSNHKNGRRHILEDEAAIKIAKILGLDPIQVLADQAAERSNDESAKKYWLQIAKKAKGAVALCTSGLLVFPALPKTYSVATALQCILCKIGYGNSYKQRAHPF